MDSRFLQSWFNSEHTVLGRKLHPFCAYDVLILAAAESPFVAESEGPVPYDFTDLEKAVWICSNEPKYFLDARMSEGVIDRARMWWWGRTIRRQLERSPKRFIRQQGDAFNAYLEDFNAGPKFWADEKPGGTVRAPWILANVTFVIRNTNFSAEEAWRLPLGQLFWYSAGLAEQMGTSSSEIMSEEEEAAMKEMGIEV